jgi:hypothetical protein
MRAALCAAVVRPLGVAIIPLPQVCDASLLTARRCGREQHSCVCDCLQVVAMRELAPFAPGASWDAAAKAPMCSWQDEDPLSGLLLGSELSPQPSMGGGSVPGSAGGPAAEEEEEEGSEATTLADANVLAGALAAAGILHGCPKPLAHISRDSSGSGGSSGNASACLFAGTPSLSAGQASGGQGSWPGGSGAGMAACQRQPTASSLERQRSLLASDADIGCVVAVTFRFMHQPGKQTAA